jgi:hypothetical protein
VEDCTNCLLSVNDFMKPTTSCNNPTRTPHRGVDSNFFEQSSEFGRDFAERVESNLQYAYYTEHFDDELVQKLARILDVSKNINSELKNDSG